MNKGTIIQMQDYSIHDGDGVRTTIFLAGCPLRCKWCANPETWTKEHKLLYYPHKCVSCGSCTNVCPSGLIPSSMDRPAPQCTYCGSCTDACPQKALGIAGQETDVDTIMAQLRRDMLFFRYTNGGVTFSGGEPFSQIPFLRSLAKACYDCGITMWAETCGYFSFNESRDILEKLDHVFMDLKHMDSSIHRQYTGVGNEQILENAKNIYQLGTPLTFRIPAIPDLNLTEENILAAARFIKQNAPDAAIELLPYHELGKAKYIALGKADDFESFTTPTVRELKNAYQIFESFGLIPYCNQ